MRNTSSMIVPTRVVEPANKLVLMSASYITNDRPRFVFGRVAHWFNVEADEQEPPFATPGFVALKQGVIRAHGITSAWFSFDCNMSRADSKRGASENGVKRYQRFVSDALGAGYSIEWQKCPGRFYGDRAALERAMRPAPVDAPRAYAD